MSSDSNPAFYKVSPERPVSPTELSPLKYFQMNRYGVDLGINEELNEGQPVRYPLSNIGKWGICFIVMSMLSIAALTAVCALKKNCCKSSMPWWILHPLLICVIAFLFGVGVSLCIKGSICFKKGSQKISLPYRSRFQIPCFTMIGLIGGVSIIIGGYLYHRYSYHRTSHYVVHKCYIPLVLLGVGCLFLGILLGWMVGNPASGVYIQNISLDADNDSYR